MKEFIEKLIGRLEERQIAWAVKGTELSVAGGKRIIDERAFGISNGFYEAMLIVNQLAEEYKHCIKSSCSNCEVYDTEKHYCPKWCDVIKGTVAEIEENHGGWIPCSERLPSENKRVLCQGKNSMFVAFVDSFDGEWRDGHHYRRTNVIAWQPLPAPYQPKGE